MKMGAMMAKSLRRIRKDSGKEIQRLFPVRNSRDDFLVRLNIDGESILNNLLMEIKVEKLDMVKVVKVKELERELIG